MLELQEPIIASTDYYHACLHAINDLVSIFGPLQSLAGPGDAQSVYTKFFPRDVSMEPGKLGASPIRRLIRAMAEKQGFTVQFLPWRPSSNKNYVSWLVVNFVKRELEITFDLLKVADIIPLDVVGDRTHLSPQSVNVHVLESPEFLYTCEKVLSKILLHEMGHASLHLRNYNLAQNMGIDRVEMPPECEAEAWVYSLTVWGVLVGDHSYLARKMNNPNNPDTGYQVC